MPVSALGGSFGLSHWQALHAQRQADDSRRSGTQGADLETYVVGLRSSAAPGDRIPWPKDPPTVSAVPETSAATDKADSTAGPKPDPVASGSLLLSV